MRLITHNMLKCNVKGVNSGYPLKVLAEEVEIGESENPFTVELMVNLLRRIDLSALKSAATDLEMDGLEGMNVDNKEEVAGDVELLQVSVYAFMCMY